MTTETRTQHTPNFGGHSYDRHVCHECADSLVNLNRALLAEGTMRYDEAAEIAYRAAGRPDGNRTARMEPKP